MHVIARKCHTHSLTAKDDGNGTHGPNVQREKKEEVLEKRKKIKDGIKRV